MNYLKPLLLLLLNLGFWGAYAQDCGTVVTPEQLTYMEKNGMLVSSRNKVDNASQVEIPVKIHIVRRGDGTGGLNPSRVNTLMDALNVSYAPAKMRFFMQGDINFIDSDQFFSFTQQEEGAMAGPNDVPRVINVYFPNDMPGLCGYTRFPPSTDRIFVAAGCTSSPSTFLHEFGHYFSLFHTHGKTNNGTTDELVARVNCDRLGDNICDTPADPNLAGKVGSGCQYGGSDTDAQGEPFTPMVNNIMSYAPSSCRTDFTNGQYERIRNGFDFGRNYLNFINPNFAARFTSSGRRGCAPLTVQFTDNTAGATSRRWEFTGGDVSTSFSPNPTVSFAEPGQYNVRLIVESSIGEIDTLNRNGFVIVEDRFENAVEGNAPLSESFSEASLPEKWEIFNDDQLQTFQNSGESSSEDGSGSFYLNNFEYEAEVLGQLDELVAPNYRLGEISALTLNFDYAYTYRVNPITDIVNSDTLKIIYQLGCDETSLVIWEKGGNNLATAPPSNDPFIPQASQWQNETISLDIAEIDLEELEAEDVIKIGFQSISYNGNNLYLDNIQLTPSFAMEAPGFLKIDGASATAIGFSWFDASFNETGFIIERSTDNQTFAPIGSVGRDVNNFVDTDFTVGIDYYYRVAAVNSQDTSDYSNVLTITRDITSIDDPFGASNRALRVFPNPAQGEVNIATESNQIGSYRVEILDHTGKVIFQEEVSLSNPEETIRMATDRFQSGYYIIRLHRGNRVQTRPLVITK